MIYLTVRALDKKERLLVLAVHRTLRGLLKTQYLSLCTCEHDTYVFIHSMLKKLYNKRGIYSMLKKLYNKRGNQINLKVGPN